MTDVFIGVHPLARQVLLLALGLSLIVMGLAGPAAAQNGPPAPRVLVMPFSVEVTPSAPGGEGATLWLGEAAALLLAEDLTDLGVTAIPREERVAAFDRLQLPMSASLTRATMIRVGELIGATDVVLGEVRLGDRLEVRAHLLELGAGHQRPDVRIDGDLAHIFDLFADLANRLASSTGQVSSRAVAHQEDLPLEVFEDYVKGLVATAPAAQRRFLESAATAAPQDARILMALWSVYSAAGAHDRALGVAGAVPAASRYARRARFAVAQSLIELRRFDGAFNELALLMKERRDPAVANALGVVQMRRGSPAGTDPASVYFGRAVQAAPERVDYLFNLGYAQAKARSSEAALRSLREAVRLDAADGDAHLVMAAVLQASGRAPEAARELELARLLGTSIETPGAAAIAVVPPGLERLVTDLDAVSEARLNAVMTAPAQRDQETTAAYHLERGRRLVVEGHDREATDELRRAVYLTPYEDEPHLLLGRIYQRAGRLSQAIDEFKVALWCRDSSAGRVALGAALLESGDREAARVEAQRAVTLDPTSVEARALLARIQGGVPGSPVVVLPSGASR